MLVPEGKYMLKTGASWDQMLAEEADSAVNTSYSLEFEIDKNRIVRVKLAGGYPFTPDIRSSLYRLNGIADIREL